MQIKNLPDNGQVLRISDFDMYYEVHGNGIPLLLLHGFTGSGGDLLSLFESFTDQYQLIIPDLRGHGRSTNPSQEYTFKQSALDVFALLEHLNINNCNAVGFSGGGCTLLQMAIQKPDLFPAMALISATTHFPEQTQAIMHQFATTAKTEAEWKEMRRVHFNGDEQIKLLWQQAGSLSSHQEDMNITPSQLATIKTKTLIMQGDRDPLYPIDITIDMYKHMQNAYLWIIPNGGHVPITDKVKPSFLNYLSCFLSE